MKAVFYPRQPQEGRKAVLKPREQQKAEKEGNGKVMGLP